MEELNCHTHVDAAVADKPAAIVLYWHPDCEESLRAKRGLETAYIARGTSTFKDITVLAARTYDDDQITPLFVLYRNGQEVNRLTGYKGPVDLDLAIYQHLRTER